jgi:tetratricopeptide (TPR) repeat protein
MFLDDHAEGLREMGLVALARGRAGEARGELQDSLRSSERIPEAALNAFTRSTIERTLRCLAQAEDAAADPRAAKEHIDRALSLAQSLVQDAPDDPEAKQHLAEALDTAADVARGKAATELYAQALEAFDRMPSPRPPQAELERAMSAWKLGHALRADDAARERARQAAEEAEGGFARLAARGVLGKGQVDAWHALVARGPT